MRLEFNPRALCYNLYCDTLEEHDTLKQMLGKRLMPTDVKTIDNMIYADTDSVKEIKQEQENRKGYNMELQDTINDMCSEDYKERFKAEYWQVRIRRHKLAVMLNKYHAGHLQFIPETPIEILEAQLGVMNSYIMLLKYRAKIESIDLE